MSPSRIAAEHVGLAAVLAAKPGLRDAACGRIAQLAEPADPGHVPEVGQVEQALDLIELALVDLQRVAQLLAQPGAHRPVDLEPHDLAEAAAPELLLDRLQQVVGLVGDVVVRVARDPEERVVGHLHARETGSPRLAAIRSSSGTRVVPVSPISTKRPQQLLRHLDPGDDLGALVRVAEADGQAQRQVRDVRERPAEPDRQRGQRREDALLEHAVELLALASFGALRRDDPDPVLGERRPELALEASRQALALAEDPLPDRVDLVARRSSRRRRGRPCRPRADRGGSRPAP